MYIFLNIIQMFKINSDTTLIFTGSEPEEEFNYIYLKRRGGE